MKKMTMKSSKPRKFLHSLFEPYTYNIKDNLAARWGLIWTLLFFFFSFLGHYTHDVTHQFFPSFHDVYWFVIFISFLIFPIVGATGTLEIKENLETAQQLHRSTIKYRTLVENLPEIIYSSSPQNRFIINYISSNIQDICGYKPEDFYLSSDMFKRIIHPEDLDMVLKNSENIVSAVCLSYRIKHKDTRNIHYVRDRLIPVIEGNKKIAIEGILVDVTSEISAKKRLTGLTRQIIDAQEKEKHRIAKELHDEVGQAITTIKINLNLIGKELGNNSAKIEKILNQTDQIAGRLLVDLKRISLDLRPSMLDDLGLEKTLNWYIKEFQERTRTEVIYTISDIDGRLPPDIEITIYRIVQEALTNIVKHSLADKVFINIKQLENREMEGKKIYVYIADNGRGFSVENAFNPETRGIGFGIIGMQERVQNLGGKFTISSSNDKGTKISFQIPFGFNV